MPHIIHPPHTQIPPNADITLPKDLIDVD